VTTQNNRLQRAIVVPDKAQRVHQFHSNTVHALAEMVAAMGLEHPSGLTPYHVAKRVSQREVMTFGEIYPIYEPGDLVSGEAPERFQMMWDLCRPGHLRTGQGGHHIPLVPLQGPAA
jgi:hypothetical protein